MWSLVSPSRSFTRRQQLPCNCHLPQNWRNSKTSFPLRPYHGSQRALRCIHSTIRSTWKLKLKRTQYLFTVLFRRNSILTLEMVSGKPSSHMSLQGRLNYLFFVFSGPIQIRMFKTERTKQSELLRNPTMSSRLKDVFGGSVRPDYNTSMQSETLNKLLNQADDKSIDSSAVSFSLYSLITTWNIYLRSGTFPKWMLFRCQTTSNSTQSRIKYT